MQIECRAAFGQSHFLFVAFPVLEPGIIGQAFLFQLLEAVLVALLEQGGAFEHHLVRRPGLGIDHVSILKGRFHAAGHFKCPAALAALLLSQIDHLGNQAVAFGISQADLHAETGHQADNALGHGERLAITGRVGPAHCDFLAAQIFERAEMTFQLQQVGQRLCGMVNIALEIDDTGSLVEDAPVKPFLHRLRDFAHIGIAFAQVHVVADADRLGQKRNHVGGLAHGFAMGDLGLLLVQLRQAQTQGIDGRGEAEPGAGRVVAEDRDGQAGVKHPERLARLVQLAQALGQERHRAEFVAGLFPGQEKILAVTVELQLMEFSDVLL